MKTLKDYIENKGITIKEAASQLGVSRALVHYAISGRPVSRRTALKIEGWSGGEVSAVELIMGAK